MYYGKGDHRRNIHVRVEGEKKEMKCPRRVLGTSVCQTVRLLKHALVDPKHILSPCLPLYDAA